MGGAVALLLWHMPAVEDSSSFRTGVLVVKLVVGPYWFGSSRASMIEKSEVKCIDFGS
jgi:hypothetical protein